MSNLQKLRQNEPYEPMWKLVTLINKLMFGCVNSIGTVTLAVSATTTTLMDNNISPGSIIHLEPQTANASTARAGLWQDPSSIPVPNGGSITLHHASSANTDQTFGYRIDT